MMNTQNAINDIHALVANGEVSDAVAEKLLPIVYWLEAELKEEKEYIDPRDRCNWD
jgi:hypothetical protein